MRILRGRPLPVIPGIGVAGGYGGVIGGRLVLAGGTNFPTAPPWKGGVKVWHDEIYALTPNAAAWEPAGRLPMALAGGASVSVPEGLLCIGGTNDQRAVADVLLLREGGDHNVVVEQYPPLPAPRAACSAGVIGRTVYVVAGHPDFLPLTSEPAADVFALDLDRLGEGWRVLPPLPGPGRWSCVMATGHERLFVLGGMVRLSPIGPAGKPGIGFLRDAYALDISTTRPPRWSRRPDLPRSFAAAPSPAPMFGDQVVLLGGGVDDGDIVKPMDQRDPLDNRVRVWSATTGKVVDTPQRMSPSVVVAPLARWCGEWVVISGEVQAGVRTTAVQSFQIIEAGSTMDAASGPVDSGSFAATSR